MRQISDDDEIDLLRQRIWTVAPTAALSPQVRTYPTMLSREELRMLKWLGKQHATADGVCCDLGAFLGGSTAALAEGIVSRHGPGRRRLVSYDHHHVTRAMWERYGMAAKAAYPEGGRFLDFAKTELLRELAAVVDFRSGDFVAQEPPAPPIDVLFVDIVKTPAANDHLLRAFLPRLRQNAIVVQQDYFHGWPHWDVVSMELLHDYFEPIAATEHNSALFLCKRPPTERDVEVALSARFELETFQRCLGAAARRWPLAAQRWALFVLALELAAVGEVLATRAAFKAALAQAQVAKPSLPAYRRWLATPIKRGALAPSAT